MNKQRIFVTFFRVNHYGLITNKFSTDIVRTLSKRNRFSIGRTIQNIQYRILAFIVPSKSLSRMLNIFETLAPKRCFLNTLSIIFHLLGSTFYVSSFKD